MPKAGAGLGVRGSGGDAKRYSVSFRCGENVLKLIVITVAQFCEYTKTTELDTFLQVHEISMYFIVLCHTNSNAFLYNYSNTAPLELCPSFVTCDFTKSFDSKTNIKFK